MKATPMHDMASRPARLQPLRTRDYLRSAEGWIFLLISALVLTVLAIGSRHVPLLLDQDNYLEYFRTTTLDWIVQLYDQRTSTWSFVVSLITEELGWRVWVILLNLLGLPPASGVRVTVVLLNLLVMISLLGVRRPLLGLLLWIVIPSALATVGLFQIRQGFAFAIAMVLTTRYQRPVTGWVLASFVHTTFAIPALLLIAIRACSRSKWFALGGACVMALVLASSAGFLFHNFGGRRIAEYSSYHDDFTIRLVILLLVYMLASVMVLYATWRAPDTRRQITLTELSLMHVSLVFYLMVAYVVFPLGKGRVWYCVPLLLPFLIPEIKFKNTAIWWLTAAVLLVLSADIVKSYYEGVYAYFIG